MKGAAAQASREGRIGLVVLLFAVLAAALVLSNTYFSVRQDRQLTEAAARDSSLIAVRLLDEHVQQVLKDAERSLEAVAYEVRTRSRKSPVDSRAVSAILARAQPFNTIIKTLQYVDVTGHASVSSIEYAAFQADADDRTYVQPMLAHPEWRQTVLGAPFRRFYDGLLVWPVAVNLFDAQGRYLGLISTDVSVQYFGDLYRRVAQDSDALVALVSDQGEIVVRATRNKMESGDKLPLTGPFEVIRRGGREGQLRDDLLLHGAAPVPTVYTWRKAQGYALTAIFGVSEAQVLGAWRERSRERWIGAGLFSAFLLLAGVSALLQLRQMGRAQRALRQSEARFAALFQQSPAPLALLDLGESRIEDANECFLKQFGYAREAVLGRTPRELQIWRHPELREGYLERLRVRGQVTDFEVEFCDSQGRPLICLLSSHLVQMGEREMVIFAPIDVTAERAAVAQLRELNETLEQRVAERTSRLSRTNAELSQANRDLQTARHALARTERLAALGTLVAGISHEVNTPLGNAISMCTALQARFMQLIDSMQQETLKRGALLDFLRGGADGADIMLRNVQRVVNLISALRDLVGNSRGFARREFRLDELLRTCSAQYQERLALQGGGLQLEAPPNIVMEGYPLALAEVVEQLLDNALEHGLRDHSGGVVRLVASLQGENVSVRVSDDGRGMVPDVRERIFDPFFTTRLGQGTSGLGMYIVYNLVNLHLGGSVTVDSQPERGCTVTLVLPVHGPQIWDEAPLLPAGSNAVV